MRLLVAALFVTLLAPVTATPALACEGDDEIARRQEHARAARRAQREAWRARREAERARREVDRARRQAERAYREGQRQPFAQPPPPIPGRPKAGPQPIDPYADPLHDPKNTQQKLERLQKKLDKLRDRLGKFQVPAPPKKMKIEIQPMPDLGMQIDWSADDDY